MERAMQTLNVADKTIEVRIASDKKTGNTLWMAFLMDKPNQKELRLCTRDNRQECLEFVQRFVSHK